MKNMPLLFLLLLATIGYSQTNTSYKYAIVPAKFSFFKEADKYGVNTLTKLFMEKYGFTTFFDTDILPADIAAQKCNTVYVDVIPDNGMLITKLKVVMKDCTNKVLFTSETGESRSKEYKIAYNQALRSAFKSFTGNIQGISLDNSPVTATNTTPFPEAKATGEVYNAQAIENGYQLIDTTPKVILKIYTTSQPNIYIAKGDTNSGILLNSNGQWVYEYYEGNKLVTKNMTIKF